MAPRNVTLFTKSVCSACDSAKFILKKVRNTIPFTYQEIHIDDPAHKKWDKKYSDHLPVIHLNDVEIFRNKVEERKLRDLLVKEAHDAASDDSFIPPVGNLNEAVEHVESFVKKNKLVLFTKASCGFCYMAKQIFNSLNQEFEEVDLEARDDGSILQEALGDITGQWTVPNVFIRGTSIGGFNETRALLQSGVLQEALENN